MRAFELVRVRLDEISEPYEPLRLAAAFFENHYRKLAENARSCLLKAFPGAREADGNIVIPIGPVGGRRVQTEPDEDAEELLDYLRSWGARDINLTANTLTWWDGRKMRIGRALTLLGELSRRPDWRVYETERRRKWIEGRRARGLPVLGDAERLLEVPTVIPDAETITRWMKTVEGRTARGARVTRRGELVAVVSFDPVENAHRSARRGWTSCYDPEGYRTPSYAWRMVLCSLAATDLVVWLTYADDARRLDRVIARTGLNVLQRRNGGGVIVEEQETYGSPPRWWKEWVREFIERVRKSCGSRPGVYERLRQFPRGFDPRELELPGFEGMGSEVEIDEEEPVVLARKFVLPNTPETLKEMFTVALDRAGDWRDLLELLCHPEFYKALDEIPNGRGMFVRFLVGDRNIARKIAGLLRGSEAIVRCPPVVLAAIIAAPDTLEPFADDPHAAGKILEALGIMLSEGTNGVVPEARLVRYKDNAALLDRIAESAADGKEVTVHWGFLAAGGVVKPSEVAFGNAVKRIALQPELIAKIAADLPADETARVLLKNVGSVEAWNMGNFVAAISALEPEVSDQWTVKELLRALISRGGRHVLKAKVKLEGRYDYVGELTRLLGKYGRKDRFLGAWLDVLRANDILSFWRAIKKHDAELLPDTKTASSSIGLPFGSVVAEFPSLVAEATGEELADILSRALIPYNTGGAQTAGILTGIVRNRSDYVEILEQMGQYSREALVRAVEAVDEPEVLLRLVHVPSIVKNTFLLRLVLRSLLGLGPEGKAAATRAFWYIAARHPESIGNLLSELGKPVVRWSDTDIQAIADLVVRYWDEMRDSLPTPPEPRVLALIAVAAARHTGGTPVKIAEKLLRGRPGATGMRSVIDELVAAGVPPGEILQDGSPALRSALASWLSELRARDIRSSPYLYTTRADVSHNVVRDPLFAAFALPLLQPGTLYEVMRRISARTGEDCTSVASVLAYVEDPAQVLVRLFSGMNAMPSGLAPDGKLLACLVEFLAGNSRIAQRVVAEVGKKEKSQELARVLAETAATEAKRRTLWRAAAALRLLGRDMQKFVEMHPSVETLVELVGILKRQDPEAVKVLLRVWAADPKLGPLMPQELRPADDDTSRLPARLADFRDVASRSPEEAASVARWFTPDELATVIEMIEPRTPLWDFPSKVATILGRLDDPTARTILDRLVRSSDRVLAALAGVVWVERFGTLPPGVERLLEIAGQPGHRLALAIREKLGPEVAQELADRLSGRTTRGLERVLREGPYWERGRSG